MNVLNQDAEIIESKADESKIRQIRILIIICSIILFVPFIGNVHLFDWDEINFAESAREMIVTGDYSTVKIDYKAFHEKPPLFIWMQVLSMKIFGINEFAARFPNAIIGIISLLVIFNISIKLINYKFGIYWVLLYVGSFLPLFYFKTALIDPSFNLFMFLGVYFLYLFSNENKIDKLLKASIFVSLAVLTKGPVGFLLPSLVWVIISIYNRKVIKIAFKDVLIYTLISFLPIIIWYLYIAINSSSFVLSEFIQYHIRLLTTGDAGHSGPFYYHLVVLFIGCFPASIIALNTFRIKNNIEENNINEFRKWNIALFLVVLIIFSIVQTKILHYSSLCYFPITFLASYSMYKQAKNKDFIKAYQYMLVFIFSFIWALLMMGFVYFLANKEKFLYLIKDKVTFAVIADNNFNIIILDYLPGATMLIASVIFIFYYLKSKKNYKINIENSFLIIIASVMISLSIFMPVLAPKIEYALQGRTIQFYDKLKNEDVYVITAGFKSYAPYYYNERKYQNSSTFMQMSNTDFENYLLFGNINKNAYIVTKINYDTNNFVGADLKLIYSNGGYNFYERKYIK